MSDPQWLLLRTQEIIAKANGEIGGRDAVKAAIRERFDGNFDQLLDFAASITSVLGKLARSTYELPDEPTLFDVPQTIVVKSDSGPMFVSGPDRKLGQVRSWASDGLQHHAAQKYRFNRVMKELTKLESSPDELAWDEARLELASREGDGDAKAE